MIFIAYILIAIATLVMVYFGHAQGTSQFYMSIFSAAIIFYCIYLDYKKRREKKDAENNKNKEPEKVQTVAKTSNKKNTKNISQIAHRSTKDKNLNNE
jgi:flagellar biosynthesis component FlhA